MIVMELVSRSGPAKIAQMERDIPIMMTLIRRVSPALYPLEMSSEYIDEPMSIYMSLKCYWRI